MKFSAVILAGGKSSRMGRDKALLEVDGQPLLARQVQLARNAGADDVFISGRVGADYAAFNCRVLRDRLNDSGPLAGIESALAATTTPLLLVLAVDMPDMSVDLLRHLAMHCTETTGSIPRVRGASEPLAAFYPKAALRLLAQLVDARRSLTPALSRRERESQSNGCHMSEARPAKPTAGLQERRRTIPLLPARAGWREGEQPAKSPSAKQFAERCVAARLATFVDIPATDAHFYANWNSPADLPCLK